jgi:hypothetical protein
MRDLIIPLIIAAIALTAASCGDEGSSQTKKVGGCSSDTLAVGVSVELAGCAGPSPVRLSILSVEPAGEDTYREAASGLVAMLSGMGVGICEQPRLIVITDGPCWPAYRIDLRLEKGSEKRFGEIRDALEKGSLAGSRPVEKRPDDYGIFFVQAGVGSSDRWTLWYYR